jgi:hypothetical protein
MVARDLVVHPQALGPEAKAPARCYARLLRAAERQRGQDHLVKEFATEIQAAHRSPPSYPNDHGFMLALQQKISSVRPWDPDVALTVREYTPSD